MKMKKIKDLLDVEVEKPVLEGLYLEAGVETDQLRRDPKTLYAISDAFNRITSHNIEASTLLRYMLNRRKQKDWPRLSKNAKKFESVLNLLTDNELKILRQIYISLDLTSDEFLFDPDKIRYIERKFEGLSGKQQNR